MTVYFWWENVKGIPESSEALRIMSSTVMVVLLMVRLHAVGSRRSPPPPLDDARRLHFAPRTHSRWLSRKQAPHTVGLLGIFIGLGHSILAMSGEESLAQVYREIHVRAADLKKTGLVIFIYSMVFALVVLRRDDHSRRRAQELLRKFDRRIGDECGRPLMLPAGVPWVCGIGRNADPQGAVNTAIVGSNGVLNRVSEDTLLAAWFQSSPPSLWHILSHHRYGGWPPDSYDSPEPPGNVYLLGKAYACGLIWSFVMKGLAVLVLRFKEPGARRSCAFEPA